MRATHICLVSMLLVALCTSSTATGYNYSPHKKTITIYGQITWHKHGLKGVTVYAYDYNKMGKDLLLGSDTTDHHGYYKITYTLPSKHGYKLDKYPDVYIQVKHKRSDVYKNVDDKVKINLSLTRY